MQDFNMALYNAYISLVKTLHLSGAIDVADLVREIGDTMDYRRRTKVETAEEHEHLQTIYEGLLQLEPVLTAISQAQAAKNSPGKGSR